MTITTAFTVSRICSGDRDIFYSFLISVVANVLAGLKGAVEICGDELFGSFGRSSDDHVDPVLLEKLPGPLTHSPGNDEISALFVKPARQHPRLVRGRLHCSAAENLLSVGIDLQNGELLAVAKVHGQTSFCCGNGNFHTFILLKS